MKLKKWNIFLAFVFLLNLSVNSQQAEILNNGFENWENIDSYQEPVSWNSLNGDLASFGISPGTVSTNEAYQGLYAVKLETQSVVFTTSPAALTLGEVVPVPGDPMDRDIRGGIPCNEKPQLFEGYYKFIPQGNDRAFIACIMYKYNFVTGEQDTVGAAIFKPSQTNSQYTKFSVPFDYTGPNNNYVDETPDTMNVVITSSFKFTASSENVGSLLYVDELTLDYDTTENAVKNITKEIPVTIFPNPASKRIMLSKNTPTPYRYDLMDATGRYIYEEKILDEAQKSINIEHLTPGIYFLRFHDDKDVFQNKLIINP